MFRRQVLTKEKSQKRILSSYKGFRKFQLCLVVAIITVIFYTYTLTDEAVIISFKQLNLRQLLQNVLTPPTKKSSNKERKLILLWTPYFSRTNWLPSTKDLLCPVENCDVTSDRFQYNKSSAVVLHWRDIQPSDLPICPSANYSGGPEGCPLLVLFNKESPPHTFANTIAKINNKIHWTVTYRRDSDVIAPYGKVVPRKHVINMPEINLNRSSVCWLVSNCHTSSNREGYVEELKEFIPVEVYGKCGDRTCPYENRLLCYRWLSERCRFYLSFENSICKDYSTEKLYMAMMSGMVPVVLGGDDYARYLPPHSFINVEDFSSPMTLAEHLRQLIADDSEYLSYFNWRKKYVVRDASYRWLCDMCENLHRIEIRDVTPYEDVTRWWFNESKCSSIE